MPTDARDPKTLAALPDDALIDAVQRQTFRFFWEGAHPGSGLAPDRRTVHDVPVDDLVAIGGSGFGIMALIVAAERGWVTREAAIARLQRMLDVLLRATCYHGVLPHFMNGATGATIPFGRKDDAADLVETSFLVMGLLCARQYFHEDTPALRRLRGDIDAFWHGVEWDWFTQGGRKLLYWHWSPNNGWAMDHEIHGWNECLITYVLAASSPRHAIEPEVYHRGFAAGRDFLNGRSYHGTLLPLGMPYGGPLFFAHYSFCGLDPRGLRDRYADYWDLNCRHVQINRAHCIANPHGWRGYGPSCWGLTASDDHTGYSAHAPDNDNGTISPTAALASLPYAPDEVMRVLRHFLTAHGERLWQRYGFVDAFSEHHGWTAETFLAIDQGPIVVMMENHRSGLLWKLFMSVPEVQAGLRRLGFTSPHLDAPCRVMMTDAPDPSFEPWLEQQLQHSASAMLQSISPLHIVKHRPGFGQTVRAVAGAIVASPVLGDWQPEPDYFFHWFRDSAVVIDALRLLHAEGRIGPEALRHLADFTRFSLALNTLDGRVDAAVPGRRAGVAPTFQQYLRDDADLARAQGDGVAAETRVNPDGTLDISRWARPQHDGPPLRALALLRWMDTAAVDDALAAELATLIRFDLGFTLRHWHEPSYDIWEEDNGHHYYTLRVSAAAFEAGAAWLRRRAHAADAADPADADAAERLDTAARAVRQRLDGFWVDEPGITPGHYRSRLLADGSLSPKSLDISVILSALHAGATEGAHSVADARLHATLDRLDALFDAAYAINQRRAPGRGPAMGRYAGDVYFSGGAYYFSTLGAAEFSFRAAALGGAQAPRWFARGDAYLATVRDHTPADGALSEQFDQASGAQTSARQLAWSHAAFISCVAARRAARPAAPRRA